MVYVSKRPFVYGDFSIGPKKGLPPPFQPFAVEILREFSSTEFIGKLYERSGSNWEPASRHGLARHQWYVLYQKVRRLLSFHMEGSGVWEVQNFRDESDETGPYVAVALKYKGAT